MNQQWWYEKDGKRLGPVPVETLHSLINWNDINKDTLVWCEGMTDWTAFKDVESLNNKPITSPPPLPSEKQSTQDSEIQKPLTDAAATLEHENTTTLNNERVLVSDTPIDVTSSIQYAGRWRRFFARMFDFWLLMLLSLLPFGIAVQSIAQIFGINNFVKKMYFEDNLIFLGVLLVFLVFFIDAVVFKIFGNTLGKYLLNIRIVDELSQRPTFKKYWTRNQHVWTKGFALGIPFLNFIAFIVQYIRLGESNLTRYDEALGTRPIASPLTWWKVVLFVPLFVVVMVFVMVLNKQLQNDALSQNRLATVAPTPVESLENKNTTNKSFKPSLEVGKNAYENKDYETALKHLIPLAESGNAEAQYSLAAFYSAEESGTERSEENAIKWLRRAAQQGLPKAQRVMGGLYEDGFFGDEKDYKKAADLYKKAAENGDDKAQYKLGVFYQEGRGVPKDYAESIYWLEMAAKQKNIDAINMLAYSYEKGKIFEKNVNKAIKYYEAAASLGDNSAQYNLALLKSFDPIEQYHWFNLAASNGNDYAKLFLKELDKSMTKDQIAQAQAMTREYLTNKDKPKSEVLPEPEKPKKSNQTMTGTAFLVNKSGNLLTNAHVVNQCQTINVYSETTTHTAQLVARDAVNDMAILKTQPWSDAKPISFSKNSISLGQDIYAIGYPLPNVLALDLQMTKGNVSAVAGLGNDSRFYQISAPVQSGNSGGPLVNGYGLVSGMVTSKANIVKMKELTGDFPQNVNFALKESQLKNYLDTNGIFYLTSSDDSELKGEQIATQARKYTVLVECVK